MQTSILKTIRVINSIDNCFNHSKLGSQEVPLSHKSQNPKEVSSKATLWNTCVFSQSIFRSASICLSLLIYAQQLVLMIIHTPPSFAVNKFNAIRFCSTTLLRDDASVCKFSIVCIVRFSIFSKTVEMFTMAFSSLLTPNHGKNHLTKL